MHSVDAGGDPSTKPLKYSHGDVKVKTLPKTPTTTALQKRPLSSRAGKSFYSRAFVVKFPVQVVGSHLPLHPVCAAEGASKMARVGIITCILSFFLGTFFVLQLFSGPAVSRQSKLYGFSSQKSGRSRNDYQTDDVYLLGVGKADITGYVNVLVIKPGNRHVVRTEHLLKHLI